MNINDMTIGELREIKKFLDSPIDETLKNGNKNFSWIGKKVYIRRSGAYHYLGVVVEINEDDIILTRASWVADSMYFSDFCKNGLSVDGIEIEPFIQDAFVSVPRENSEISEWNHDLPTEPIR